MTDRLALEQFRTAAATAQREAAFAQLVRTHASWLYNAALRQVRDPAAAEEATQATFIVLASKAGGLREDTSLTAWLAKVLHLSVLRVKRDYARRTQYETKAAMTRSQEQPAENPADAAAWRELAPLLDDAVAKLSKKDREAILLRFYRQWSYAEIAVALTIGEDAARKRVDRAVERLRGTLGGRGLSGIAGVAALAALLGSNTSAVATPPGLVGTATTLAFATPSAAVAAPAAAVAKGVLTGMALGPLKIAAATVLLLGVAGLVGQAAIRYGAAQATLVRATSTTAPAALVATPGILVGELKSGVRVELIALAPSLSNDKAENPRRFWWQPDGTPLAEPPTSGRLVTAVAPADRVPVELALRVTSAGGQPPEFQATIQGSDAIAVSTSSDANRRPLVLTAALAAAVPDQPLTMRLNFASGPWTPHEALILEPATRQAAEDNTPDGRPTARYRMTLLDENPLSGENEYRVIGIETGGHEHVANSLARNVLTRSSVVQLEFEFNNVNAERLQAFRVESRRRDQWVEFRNLSIHKGHVTSPTVATSDDASPEVAVAADQRAMQGEWMTVKYQPGGDTSSKDFLGPVTMKVAGSQMTIHIQDLSDATTFTLDPSHTPKWIDFGRPDGNTDEGIYEWQGQTLRIRVGQRSQLTGFDAGPGTAPGVLMEFVRATPMTPENVADQFFTALGAKQFDRAASLTTSDYAKAHPQAFETLARFDLSGVRAEASAPKGEQAAVVSSGFQVNGRLSYMGLTLVRESDRWLIRDIDALPSEPARQRFLVPSPPQP